MGGEGGDDGWEGRHGLKQQEYEYHKHVQCPYSAVLTLLCRCTRPLPPLSPTFPHSPVNVVLQHVLPSQVFRPGDVINALPRQ